MKRRMSRVVLTEKWNHNEKYSENTENTVKRCSNVPETIVSDHKPHFVFGVFADRSPQHQNVSWSSSELTWPAKVGSYHAPKNTPRTGCIFAHTTNPQPKPFQPTSSPPKQRNTPPMWRHQTMCRQRMWRQNVASQENVASPNNVAPNNVAPKCGVTGKCGVAKQCGAKQCGAKMWRHRKMWRHQTMWRQTMQRQNVASQENAASPNNVAPNNVAPHVFEMCLHNVSSASGGKARALLPTPCIILYYIILYYIILYYIFLYYIIIYYNLF